MDGFKYSPLTTPTSIRLLKIIENDEQSPLQCELIEMDFEAKEIPKYAALSYCWGDPNDTRDIICNGKPLTITATLELALRMTQIHNPNETIWVDQACMDQSDAMEKVQQIRIMTTIFQGAWTIIGWLGPEDPTTGIGIKQVKVVGRTHEHEDYSKGDFIPKRVVRSEADMSTSAELRKSMEEDPAAWLAFSRFFDRPWFTRVWVVQEMLPALQTHLTEATHAIIVCGQHVIDWWFVFNAAIWASRNRAQNYGRPIHEDIKIDGVAHTYRLNVSAFSRFAYVLSQQPIRTIGRYQFEVLDLLRNFRNREASDPRDKLFGLLGLSNFIKMSSEEDAEEAPSKAPSDITSRGSSNSRSSLILVAKIPVDYSLSVLEVYRAFARIHIEDAVKGAANAKKGRSRRFLPPNHPDHGLEILNDVTPRSKQPGWPSWVPDWRAEGIHGHLYFPITHPSRARSTSIEAVLYPHPDPSCLKVGGMILGRASWVHEGHHMPQVVKASDPRALGKWIASQIGSRYKYGSAKHNVKPELYRQKSKPRAQPKEGSDTQPDERSEDNADNESCNMVNHDDSEKESTETALLWLLSLNDLPPIFSDAQISSSEYASSQIMYNLWDAVRPNAPPWDLDEAQWQLIERLKAVWNPETSLGDIDSFFRESLCDRRLFFTDSGYLGLAHDDIKVGDEVAILFGMGTVCILRPNDRVEELVREVRQMGTEDGAEHTKDEAKGTVGEGEKVYRLIGNAYVRGASHGEVIEEMYHAGQIKDGEPVGIPITLR